MKKCPICSNMVDDSFAFCPHCGQKIEIAETDDKTNPSDDKANEISQQPDSDNNKDAESSVAPQDEGRAPVADNENNKSVPETEDKQPVQEDLTEAADANVVAQTPDTDFNPETPAEKGMAETAQQAPVQDMTDENPLEYNPNLGGGQEYDHSQNDFVDEGTYTEEEGSYVDPDTPLGYEMTLIEEDDNKVNIPPKKKKSKVGWAALALLLLAAAGGAAYYFLNDFSQAKDAAAEESDKTVNAVKQTPERKLPQQTDSIDAEDEGDDVSAVNKVDKGVSKSQDEIDETQNVISDKAKENNGGSKQGMKGIQNFEKKKEVENNSENGPKTKKEERKAKKEQKDLGKEAAKKAEKQKKEQKKAEEQKKKEEKKAEKKKKKEEK